ncbi:hypothetical protein CsSME_00010139 [Camellia sinensis var. sinensis]
MLSSYAARSSCIMLPDMGLLGFFGKSWLGMFVTSDCYLFPTVQQLYNLYNFVIRLAEAQQQKTVEQDMKPEQLEKMAKLEGWRKELKLLEDRKAELS